MYTLKEVAEWWQKSENDILRMAIDGKIVLSAWWDGFLLLDVGVGIAKGCAFAPMPRLHKGLFAIRRDTIRELLACGEPLKVLFFENGGQHLYFSDYVLDERVPLELTRKKIFIDSTHLADAEAKHPGLVSHSHSIVQPTVREPERPLRGMKAIAEYCGVHQDTIKNWRKQCKDFPATSSGRGAVTALPSELNAWMTKNKKNDMTPNLPPIYP